MDPADVLEIVIREMLAYVLAWRADWSGFDGRQLLKQLQEIDEWATQALAGQTTEEYRKGTEFLKGS